MKIYLVLHEDFVPHEGVVKQQTFAFANESDAITYCENNSVKEEQSYNYSTGDGEEHTKYIVKDSWAPEYMFIQELNVLNEVQEFKSLYTGGQIK